MPGWSWESSKSEKKLLTVLPAYSSSAAYFCPSGRHWSERMSCQCRARSSDQESVRSRRRFPLPSKTHFWRAKIRPRNLTSFKRMFLLEFSSTWSGLNQQLKMRLSSLNSLNTFMVAGDPFVLNGILICAVSWRDKASYILTIAWCGFDCDWSPAN